LMGQLFIFDSRNSPWDQAGYFGLEVQEFLEICPC